MKVTLTFNLLVSRYAGIPCWNWLLVASDHETSRFVVSWLVALPRAGKTTSIWIFSKAYQLKEDGQLRSEGALFQSGSFVSSFPARLRIVIVLQKHVRVRQTMWFQKGAFKVIIARCGWRCWVIPFRERESPVHHYHGANSLESVACKLFGSLLLIYFNPGWKRVKLSISWFIYNRWRVAIFFAHLFIDSFCWNRSSGRDAWWMFDGDNWFRPNSKDCMCCAGPNMKRGSQTCGLIPGTKWKQSYSKKSSCVGCIPFQTYSCQLFAAIQQNTQRYVASLDSTGFEVVCFGPLDLCLCGDPQLSTPQRWFGNGNPHTASRVEWPPWPWKEQMVWGPIGKMKQRKTLFGVTQLTSWWDHYRWGWSFEAFSRVMLEMESEMVIW